MLERALTGYLTAAPPPKALPKLATYVDSLRQRRLLLTARFVSATGAESLGVRLLRHALALADVPLLNRHPDDYARMTAQLLFLHDDMDRLFDQALSGRRFQGLFVARHPGQPCQEYLLPVRCPDYATALPFNRGWEAWQAVRPLRLLDLSSNELSYHVYQDQLHFKVQPPRHAVFSVDTVALALQYAAYRRATTRPLPVAVYLHKHVVMPGLMEDLTSLWLRSRYLALLRSPGLAGLDRAAVHAATTHNAYGLLGTQFPAAMEELHGQVQNVRRGTVPAQTLLASLPLATQALSAHYATLTDTTALADQRQYRWVTYLRDSGWLDLVFAAARLDPDDLDAINLERAMRRDLPLLQMSRFWSAVHDPSVRGWIEAGLAAKLASLTARTTPEATAP